MSKDIHQEIAEYLVSNPKAFIYYHDRGGWLIYPHKPRDVESGDFKLKPVYEGDDYNNLNGYIPTLVEIMAIALKIRMYSI
jgi:hypothetical protein